jgi:hypothetical protein
MVTDSTISGNHARNDGGGISNVSDSQAVVVNSTLSGNTAGTDGGAISNYGEGSQDYFLNESRVVVINSTIVNNRANGDGDGSGTGGGIWSNPAETEIRGAHLFNTLVAGNRVGTGNTANDIGGKPIEPGSAHNLVGDPLSAGGLQEAVNGNRVGDGNGQPLPLEQIVEPNLASNGGTTLTHALVSGSLAIDAGGNAFATTLGITTVYDDRLPGQNNENDSPLQFDQRGEPFVRVAGFVVDIGAFEVPKTDSGINLVESAVAIRRDNNNLVITGQQVLAEAPLEGLGKINICGTDMDDTITLDFSGGDLIPANGLLIDGGGGSNQLIIGPGDADLDLTTTGRTDLARFDTIDLSDPAASQVALNAAVIPALAPVTNTIRVIAGLEDELDFEDASDWRMDEPLVDDGKFILTATHLADANDPSVETDNPRAWHNFVQPSDVNNDGSISALDALRVINELARIATTTIGGELAPSTSALVTAPPETTRDADVERPIEPEFRVVKVVPQPAKISSPVLSERDVKPSQRGPLSDPIARQHATDALLADDGFLQLLAARLLRRQTP